VPGIEEARVRINIPGSQGTSSPIPNHQETPKQEFPFGNKLENFNAWSLWISRTPNSKSPSPPPPRESQVPKPPSLTSGGPQGPEGIPSWSPRSIYLLDTVPRD
jgi:hypothetical protein